ncbi:hypothetical protein HN419_00660 [Candidatus Woesearchaeota archaeon]|jgi:NAD+ kinase|nr:hypothetical protein [Candidatus Woesearchaeota archaeon]MBT3537492.1 hypothetical protein [Candidatus Woesearchaeota archaeon]MBT4697239.1 hypothetical protein [Candidatus Woesearchaeota archaeon]MBT4717617.1 hypothetical protein [Candidatus Woesearchaeota archaeon]MBT7106198.1 hypothetical protein [Candidatus Woesearchaeota archaeon]
MKIKKVAIIGQHSKKIESTVKDFGFSLVRRNPEAVICYGGDGTLLLGEHKYPRVPKIAIKRSQICNTCAPGSTICNVLKALSTGKYGFKDLIKIEGKIVGKRKAHCIGLNEVQLHNIMPGALRFSVYVDGKLVEKDAIGDGLIVATPFGSTAYFHSITRKKFSKGVGIAFNNTTKLIKPLILNERQKIKVKVTRVPGFMTSDNNAKKHRIKDGDVVEIKVSKDKARILFPK